MASAVSVPRVAVLFKFDFDLRRYEWVTELGVLHLLPFPLGFSAIVLVAGHIGCFDRAEIVRDEALKRVQFRVAVEESLVRFVIGWPGGCWEAVVVGVGRVAAVSGGRR